MSPRGTGSTARSPLARVREQSRVNVPRLAVAVGAARPTPRSAWLRSCCGAGAPERGPAASSSERSRLRWLTAPASFQYLSQPVSDVLIADGAVVLAKAGAVRK